jgi:hypothetical protein
MFSLFDLEDLCGNERKLRTLLESYGVLRDFSCECSGSLGDESKDGSSSYQRCKKCRKKFYAKSSSILESSTLSLKQWTHLVYLWAHDCAGARSVRMLGVSSATVATWSQRFRVCVLNYEAANSDLKPFGGKDLEVEADECEIGRKRKGLHGHDTDVKGNLRDFWCAS